MTIWDLLASEEFKRLVTIIPPTYGNEPSPAEITSSVADTEPPLVPVVREGYGYPLFEMPLESLFRDEPSPVEKAHVRKDFLTIPELATRWRIARPTVYNRLRSAGLRVLDFAPKGGRGRKVVPLGAILEIERKQLKRV